LVSLYQESDKPQNALDYLKRNFNAPDDLDTENLKNEYLKLKDENEKLKKKMDELQKEVKFSFFNFFLTFSLNNIRTTNDLLYSILNFYAINISLFKFL
jgi:hypothetical protein